MQNSRNGRSKFIGRSHFKYPLDAENLAHLLGLELDDMQRQLEQLHTSPVPYVDEDEKGNLVLSLDGLPYLIKQMAFNIPTTDIIENLTCQVLHLAAMHEDYASLQNEMVLVEQECSKLDEQMASLHAANETLKARINELENQGFGEKLTRLFRKSG